MEATFEAKIKDEEVYPVLEAMAELMGRVERRLFVDRYVKRLPLNDLKARYQKEFGITARQFNAIGYNLAGKVAASQESLNERESGLKGQLEATQKTIKRLEKKVVKAKKKAASRKKKGLVHEGEPSERARLMHRIHQKQRRSAKLQQQLKQVATERERGIPSICFGSRKLFREQFGLEANGYPTHQAWQAQWRQRRSSQVYCLGSKDETAGNQTCQLLAGGKLVLRVPYLLSDRFGDRITIEGIAYRYGQEVVTQALQCGQALHHRLVRRVKQGKVVWYVQTTTERCAVPVVTRRTLGAFGVDLNPGVVAVARIDRNGNPTATAHLPVQLQGRRSEQVEASLGNVVAGIVSQAKAAGVPVVVEALDFRSKKARLRESGDRYARMLSAFAYRKFWTMLQARAAREGVEVVTVNPAFTSVIGQVKFGDGYGLSRHTAAAVAIARRGLKFGERLRSRVTFALPARNRAKHVWSDWRRVAQRLRADGARGRRSSEDQRGGRGIPSTAAPPKEVRPVVGSKTASLPGCDSPALVGKAVRLATG